MTSAVEIERAIDLLRSAHWHTVERTVNEGLAERLIHDACVILGGNAVAAERERCLRCVDRFNVPGHSVVGPTLANIADAIRREEWNGR